MPNVFNGEIAAKRLIGTRVSLRWWGPWRLERQTSTVSSRVPSPCLFILYGDQSCYH